MQQLISHVILPIVLAFIMFGMGLGLRVNDFYRILLQPKSYLLAGALQILFLPLLALLIIALLPLSNTAAAGLFLVALCPGGATSSLFTYFAKGNIALSITLTGCISMLSPFILPLLFANYVNINNHTTHAVFLPLIPTIKQLIAVTLVPIIFGMMLRYFVPSWSDRIEANVKKIAGFAMLLVVITLFIGNPKVMSSLLSVNALAVLLLATTALIAAYYVSGICGLVEPIRRTIAIEVGIQNAGTAMMVALTILHDPQIAFVPLMYGLLMNVPALLFILWVTKKHPS